MAAQPPHPELRHHLTKPIRVKLNKDRIVDGLLVGYDHFMNLSLRKVQITAPGIPTMAADSCIIRGATILSFEGVNN